MRDAFIRSLTALAERDDRVLLLTGDLGFKLFDDFARRYAGRYLNAGVAEANMVGVAAGLALEGFRPFVYSIVPFATLRCLEQIRNDVCHHNAPVTIVGIGGGYSYGLNGPTHHSLEDVGVMRTLPNLTVVCPGDPVETELAVAASTALPGPLYLRLGRAGEPLVHQRAPEFRIGSAITVEPGSDCALISNGSILPVVMEASRLLRARSVNPWVVSMHTVKPLDSDLLERCHRDRMPIFVVEEHGRAAGFASAIGEWFMERRLDCPMISFAAHAPFTHICGNQKYLRKREGLTAENIAGTVMERLEGARC